MKREELLKGLSSTYGKEKAKDIVGEIITSAGLPIKEEYAKAEMLQICDVMIGGNNHFQQMMGGYLRARVLMMRE
jgi:hypothetical protein